MPSIAKLESVIAEVTGGAAESDSGSESLAGAPPTGEDSGSESAPAAHVPVDVASADGAPAGATNDQEQKRALLAEKLREVRERRSAQRLREQAKAAKAEAESLRAKAAEEEASWKAVRGNYKEGFAKLGVDPQTVLREMVKEATEAGTPEAQIARMQAEFEKKLMASVEPLQKTIEQLNEERNQARIGALRANFQSDFVRAVQAEEFAPLRDEYEDGQILAFADMLRQQPQKMLAAAREFRVPLTAPDKGFTIREILSVLRAQQEAHEKGRQARRAQRSAATSSQTPEQASSDRQTVNGTAERRNAGAQLGNELASSRASEAGTRKTRAERVRELIGKG